MNIYQSTTTSSSDGSKKAFVFPYNSQFLVVYLTGKNVNSAETVDAKQLNIAVEEAHYFDYDINFNLLPKLSDEMVNDEALIAFMNWSKDKKVYKQLIASHNIEVQFQPETIADHAISKSIPSVNKHHLTELILSSCEKEGVTALYYQNKIHLAVINHGDVKLCNSFDAKTDEEVLYYLLLVYQELQLSQEEIPLLFFGQFPEKHELTAKYLSAYIRNTSVEVFPNVEHPFQGILKLIELYHANN